MSETRAVLTAALLILATFAAGCGSPTPPPSPSASAVPTGANGSPLPSGATNPPVDGSPGADLFDPEPQIAFPGIYVPAGFLAQGTENFALIQAPFDCPTLTDVIAAGQWTLADQASIPLPTPDPAQSPLPTPDLNPPEWLLLRWGDESAVARVGGDADGCIAQIWRVAQAQYTAHGAIESSGSAEGLQVSCAAGDGVAEVATFYFGSDGTFYSIQTTVPLKVGSHALDEGTELRAGIAPNATVERAFLVLYTGDPGQADISGIVPYYPADLDTLAWSGTIEVTSVDPLVGEITFDDAVNEDGDSLSLTTTFRCDLRPGALTRAAEAAANATPSPAPSPSPAPGEVTVVIDSGPHAGTHEAQSSDATCSINALGPGWLVSYSALEPVAGELQAFSLTLPEDGGKVNVTMYFGDDFDADWFLTDEADGEVLDNGATVQFVVTGHDAGTDFTIDFLCRDVARF